MGKHTPGPWSIGPSPFAESSDSLAVLEPKHGAVVCDFGDFPTTLNRANAALISAAPDLLDFAEAAGGVIAWAKDNGANKAAMKGLEAMRRAAISKAKGETE